MTQERQAGSSGQALPGTWLITTRSCRHRMSPQPTPARPDESSASAHPPPRGYGEDAPPALSIKRRWGQRQGEDPFLLLPKAQGLCQRRGDTRCIPTEHGGHRERPHQPPPAQVRRQDPQRTASPRNTSGVTTRLLEARDKGLVPEQGLQEEQDGDGRVSEVTCPQLEPQQQQ